MTTATRQSVTVVGPRYAGGQDVTIGRAATVAEAREIFATEDAAKRRAAAVLPIDAFGVVQITPVEFVPYDEADAARFPHAGYWAVCGETVTHERE